MTEKPKGTSRRQPRNLTISVHDRLLNLARERHEELQLILMRYAIERLLYRLGKSPYNSRFIVKGAILFTLWGDAPYRPTHDLDLLGYGASEIVHLEAVFRHLCQVEVEDDGLVFLANAVHGQQIRETQEYGGVRISMLAMLGKARIPVQVDIGFGDVVTPAPQETLFQGLLGFSSPVVQIYPRETVVAEKFEAMVRLGMANTRMKDFYDLWKLATTYDFDGAVLSSAIQATFARRQAPLPNPEQEPIALTTDFSEDRVKRTQWQAFLRKAKLQTTTLTLEEAIQTLRQFLLPPTLSASFDYYWPVGGSWQAKHIDETAL